jgi:2-polyprenyl-3-methyl-5-hydroxy-6-metoxy-1,4-benzoquinol methylase
MSFERLENEYLPIDHQKMRPIGFLERSTNLAEVRFKSVLNGSGFSMNEECPICHSKKNTIEFIKFNTNILKCHDCTVRYVEKFPNNVNDVYSNENYLDDIKTSLYSEGQDNYRKKRFGTERVSLIRRFIEIDDQTSILDIGCGTGWFLDLMKENGLQIYGVELGEKLNQWTSERLGINIFNVELENTPLQKHNIITMFDLLEHVKNPIQLLTEVKKRLKHGGIAVVFTPNFDSFALNIMKEMSNLVSPVEHLVYFTKDSILKLAEIVGLEIIHYETKGNDIIDLKSFYEYKGMVNEANLMAQFSNKLQCLIDAADAANHMRVVFRNE